MERDSDPLNQLETEGIIQRFEDTFQLAWKVLKDKMENDGSELDKISPKAVVRQALARKYSRNPDVWLQLIGDRNRMSHTYDFQKFGAIIQTLREKYLPLLDDWYLELQIELNDQSPSAVSLSL